VRRPESGTTTGPAGWPTGPAGQGEAWVAHGTGITQLAALAQVWGARTTSGGPGQRRGAADSEEGRRSAAAGTRHYDRVAHIARQTQAGRGSRAARGTGITQLAALAQVWAARSTSGGSGQWSGTRIPTGSGRATAISSQSVKSVGQSARGGHHSAGRPGRNQSRHKSVADKFSTPLSGRASVQHPNQTRFDGGELDLVIFGAHLAHRCRNSSDPAWQDLGTWLATAGYCS